MYEMGTFWRNGHVLGKRGRNGQYLGKMCMFHRGLVYKPHANTSFYCFGFSILNTKLKINILKIN